MSEHRRTLSNSDITETVMAPPDGHQHLRTTIKLSSGEEIVLQEVIVVNLVRTYIDFKIYPRKKSYRLIDEEVSAPERKEGFAAWQLPE